ncbi:hypothetical protein [Pseudidiomarina donghaiensis]|uniref:hypothetical protein n=1 Tax=Pseudidiomarina donghaiensis TaxID=519452 RepID=UPI003A96A87E
MSLGTVWLLITVAIALTVGAISTQFSVPLPKDDFSSLLDFFLAVASIIFAMIGAWIVLMYSSSMHDYLLANTKKIKDEAYQCNASIDEYTKDLSAAARQTEESLASLTDALWISLLILVFVIVAKTFLMLSGVWELPNYLTCVTRTLGLVSIPLILSGLVYAIIIIAQTNLAILKGVQNANAKFRAKMKSG